MTTIFSGLEPFPTPRCTRCGDRQVARTGGSLGILVIIVLTGACASIAARVEAAEKNDGATANRTERVHETEHFSIRYDTPFEAVRPLTGRLEGTYDAIHRFCERRNLRIEPPTKRLSVRLFDRYEDFSAYSRRLGVTGRWVAGFYHHQTNVAAFCNAANSPGIRELSTAIERTSRKLSGLDTQKTTNRGQHQRRQTLQQSLVQLRMQRDHVVKRFNRFVIQHEAAHQMLFNLGVHVRGGDNPSWLVEGLACQFEVPQTSKSQPLRRVNHMRLADFRDALGVAPADRKISLAAYRAAVERGDVVPIAELISDPGLFEESEAKIAFRYAQAWALVYYLQRRHAPALATYLGELQSIRPGVVVTAEERLSRFRSTIAQPDDDFERRWVDFMVAIRFDRREAGR